MGSHGNAPPTQEIMQQLMTVVEQVGLTKHSKHLHIYLTSRYSLNFFLRRKYFFFLSFLPWSYFHGRLSNGFSVSRCDFTLFHPKRIKVQPTSYPTKPNSQHCFLASAVSQPAKSAEVERQIIPSILFTSSHDQDQKGFFFAIYPRKILNCYYAQNTVQYIESLVLNVRAVQLQYSIPCVS